MHSQGVQILTGYYKISSSHIAEAVMLVTKLCDIDSLVLI